MKSKRIFFMSVMIAFFFCSCSQKSEILLLKGPYLGQPSPGDTPVLFAPGIMATRYEDRGTPTFSPDMKEVYWSVLFAHGSPEVIFCMKQENNVWTDPQVAPFSGQYSDGSPCLSPDNKRLFFDSTRPLSGEGEPKDKDIWYVDRTETGWGTPIHAGNTINTEKIESNPSVSRSGTLFFSSIQEGYPYDIGVFQSRLMDGRYQERVFLNEKINSTSGFDWSLFVDPDERYVLFCSGREGQVYDDIYCSYKSVDESWSEPIKLVGPINSERNDRFPKISPDGRFLFFARTGTDFQPYFPVPQTRQQLLERYEHMHDDIYWVDAGFIEKCRPPSK